MDNAIRVNSNAPIQGSATFIFYMSSLLSKGKREGERAGIGPRSPGAQKSRGKEHGMNIYFTGSQVSKSTRLSHSWSFTNNAPLHPHYLDPLDFRTGSPGCQRHVLGSFKVFIDYPRALFIHTASRLAWRPYHWSSGSTWMLQRTFSSSTDECPSIFCRLSVHVGPCLSKARESGRESNATWRIALPRFPLGRLTGASG